MKLRIFIAAVLMLISSSCVYVPYGGNPYYYNNYPYNYYPYYYNNYGYGPSYYPYNPLIFPNLYLGFGFYGGHGWHGGRR